VNRFVAGFLGSPRMNFVRAEVVGLTESGVRLRAKGLDGELAVPVTTGGVKAGDAVTVGIRPEAFTDDPEGGWVLDGSIAVIESLGRETLLYLDGGALRAHDSESHEGYFAVHRTRQIAARHGDRLRMGISPDAVYLFDGADRAIAWPSTHVSTV
jgi:multiple sugar transport system ATP-binding protein